MVLIATVNNGGAGQRVAPPGGLEPRLGTNPLCAAVPTSTRPRRARLRHERRRGGQGPRLLHQQQGAGPRRLAARPPGPADHRPLGPLRAPAGHDPADGRARRPTRVSASAWCSTCSPAASRAAATQPPRCPPPGVTTCSSWRLDAAQFSGRDALVRQSECVADYVRSTPRAPGVDAILLPGDPERRTLEQRSAQGIPLEEAHWPLAELARSWECPPDSTPAENRDQGGEAYQTPGGGAPKGRMRVRPTSGPVTRLVPSVAPESAPGHLLPAEKVRRTHQLVRTLSRRGFGRSRRA